MAASAAIEFRLGWLLISSLLAGKTLIVLSKLTVADSRPWRSGTPWVRVGHGCTLYGGKYCGTWRPFQALVNTVPDTSRGAVCMKARVIAHVASMHILCMFDGVYYFRASLYTPGVWYAPKGASM